MATRVTVRIIKGNTNPRPQGPGADDGAFSQRGGTEPTIVAGASLADEDEPAAVVALALAHRLHHHVVARHARAQRVC